MTWKTVRRTNGLMEAEIIKSYLEACGLAVELRYETIGAGMGMTMDGLGVVEVQVLEEREAEAVELLEQQQES
jgi:hypothetical protein